MSSAHPTHTPKEQSFNIGVKALLVQNGQILLLKRRDYPKWETPGGQIDIGEDAMETLRRELPEELPGCRNICLGQLVHAGQTDFTLPNGNRLMLLFYEATVDLPKAIRLSEEHVDFAWVGLDALPSFTLHQPVLEAAQLSLRGNHGAPSAAQQKPSD